MEVRRTVSLVDLNTALRCFEAGEGQDVETRRALERASVRYAYKGWGFEPRRQAGVAIAPAVQVQNLRN